MRKPRERSGSETGRGPVEGPSNSLAPCRRLWSATISRARSRKRIAMIRIGIPRIETWPPIVRSLCCLPASENPGTNGVWELANNALWAAVAVIVARVPLCAGDACAARLSARTYRFRQDPCGRVLEAEKPENSLAVGRSGQRTAEVQGWRLAIRVRYHTASLAPSIHSLERGACKTVPRATRKARAF